jgi:hypothetical protein
MAYDFSTVVSHGVVGLDKLPDQQYSRYITTNGLADSYRSR